MKNKPLIYLLIAVVAAAAVWLFERPDKPRNLSTVESFKLFKGFDPSKANKIVVAEIAGQTELKSDGDIWKVINGDQADIADLNKIKGALDAIADLETGSVASINPSRQAELQVGPSALQVMVYDEKDMKLAHLFIGKSGPDFMSTYVRKDGDDITYLANKVLIPIFSINPDSWKEKKTTVKKD
jgi:hypothetical protein